MGQNIPERFACPHCGGTEISVPATAWWDEEKQDWEYSVDNEADGYCADCANYVTARFIPITDLKSAARVAIKNAESE